MIALLMGILAISPALSTITDTASIKNTGIISYAAEVVATSGLAQDIQVAVDQIFAIGGGTVYLPSGTFTFNNETVNIPEGISVIGQNTVLQQVKEAPFNTMFIADGDNIRISGIEFRGKMTEASYGGCCISIKGLDFRIDHCTFIDMPNSAIYAGDTVYGRVRGVIDHNFFDNPSKDIFGGDWGYGVIVFGTASSAQTPTWNLNITQFLGKYDTAPSGIPVVYIEDNIFYRYRHAIASNQGAWYVARYNTFYEPRPKNFGIIDVHGSAADGYGGGRGLEAYNNRIYGAEDYSASQAFWLRGGGGVVFNNEIIGCLYGVMLFGETSAPAYAQIRDLWIWNNTGAPFNAGSFGYVEDEDYFLRAPTPTQDGFNYTSYPYPHPLTL